MQRILLIILAVSTAASAWLAFEARRQLSDRDSKIAELTDQLDAARGAEKNALEQTSPLKENVRRLIAERDQLKAAAKTSGAPEATPAKPAPTAEGGAGGKEMFGGMAKMLQSEEGKKMMRAQNTMVVKMQYMDLAKRLKLSPQESDQLMGLLGDRQNALSEEAFGAFTGAAPDEARLAQLGAKAEASRKEFDEKIKATLGDDRFTQFQDYEKTIGERMLMTQFDPQFASAGAPLDPAQKEQLIEIMSAERLKSPASIFDPTASQKNPAAAFNAMRDDAAVDRWMQQEQDFQRRVLQTATKALNPDQINALQQAFQQTTEMQKFGLKMSREMFKGTAGDAPPLPPAVEKVK
jgi:hypothetical protein